jgi:3-phenylpropionate/trans-cinnamate dioxygenase ferredoxin reductase subunit
MRAERDRSGQGRGTADPGQARTVYPVPWFWSDQYEIKLQITGILDSYDASETIGNPAESRFSVEYRKAGRLIAVDAINDGRAHMLGRRRIAADLPERAAALSAS